MSNWPSNHVSIRQISLQKLIRFVIVLYFISISILERSLWLNVRNHARVARKSSSNYEATENQHFLRCPLYLENWGGRKFLLFETESKVAILKGDKCCGCHLLIYKYKQISYIFIFICIMFNYILLKHQYLPLDPS